MNWKLADAKNRFSELVNLALAEEPQFVSRRGDSVVVLSQSQYDELTGKKFNFKEFLLQPIPEFEELDLRRDKSPTREITL